MFPGSSALLLKFSPPAQLHVLEKEDQELTREEVIGSIQESVTFVDKLTEVDDLERRLREVRDLEERLQEVDEMAERIQEVIEEELGKEEVEKLREETEQEWEMKKQMLVEGTTVKVVKKSVRIMETKEEGDELEEQIKQVFLKGLLPEEEEVEVKQQREIEVTDQSVLDDSLRVRLRQMEKEWQSEVEEKLGSPEAAGSTYAVKVQKVERRSKKRVTIAEESEQIFGDADDMQEQAAVIQERLEKQDMWRKTDVLVERTLRDATLELQAGDQPQVEDMDIWYKLFDRLPYKAVFIPPGTVYCCANQLLTIINL